MRLSQFEPTIRKSCRLVILSFAFFKFKERLIWLNVTDKEQKPMKIVASWFGAGCTHENALSIHS